LGIIIVAITMAEGGLFTANQTIMLIYEVHAGSMVSTWFLSSGLKGNQAEK